MKFSKLVIASAAFLAVMGANAEVTGAIGNSAEDSFVVLSGAGLGGGSIATLSGGTVYNADKPFANIPAGGIFGDAFLAAGPASGNTATLTFTGTGVNYIGFLWGSPDIYNRLTVNSTGGSQTFSAMDLGFAVTNGNQAFSQYVNFTGVAGAKITSLSFTNVPTVDAFETANFSITPIPEPQTYALLLAGLGAVGFMARRRRS